MRLVRFTTDGAEGVGVLDGEEIVDVGVPMHALLYSWPDASATIGRALDHPTRRLSTDQVRLLTPVVPRRILATGTNYQEHLDEMKATAPPHPSAFLKLPGCELAPGAPLVLGPGDRHVDYEGELAVVLGASVRDAGPEEAALAIAGLMLANDVSARDVPTPHIVLSKGRAGFCPLGPWLVTADDLALGSITFTVEVNGEQRQHGHSASMIHSIAEIISSFSSAAPLLPGDVILTGTTSGVGVGRTPAVFLEPGDEVVVASPQLGTLRTPVVAAASRAG